MNDAIVAFTDNSIFEVAGGKVTKQDNDGDNDEFAKSDASPAAIDDWAGAIYTRHDERGRRRHGGHGRDRDGDGRQLHQRRGPDG